MRKSCFCILASRSKMADLNAWDAFDVSAINPSQVSALMQSLCARVFLVTAYCWRTLTLRVP